jgi:predicted small lipoprotein YifL
MTTVTRWMTPVLALALAACGTKGAWMGADAEKAYDKELEASRLAAVRNSDDYYEYHVDNEIIVLADKKDVKTYLTAAEIPLRVTKIGGGPNGERLVFGLVKNEAKAMEKKVGYKGGAQQMYEGTLEGNDKGFYGEVMKDGRYVVFGSWKDLQAFRQSGAANPVSSATTADGKPVTFTTDNAEVIARFKELHG